jgi:hypothetical protein
MLEGSLFKTLRQPVKGVANAITASVIGALQAQLFGAAQRFIVGA